MRAAALVVSGLVLVGCGGGSSSRGTSDGTSTPTTDSSSSVELSLSDPDADAVAFDPCVLSPAEVRAIVGFDVTEGTPSAGSIDNIRADECSYSSIDSSAGSVSVQSLYGDTLDEIARTNIETAKLFHGTVDQTPIQGLPGAFVTDVLDALTVFSIGPKPLAVSVSLYGSQGRPAERTASVAVAKAVAAAI